MGLERTFGIVRLNEDNGTVYLASPIGDPIGGSVEGAVARVDAGVVDARMTATRVVALGVFALGAKKKSGQVFLTVEHPEYAFTFAADFRHEAEMRAFAAAINNASRKHYDPERSLERPVARRITRALPPIEVRNLRITLDETTLRLEAQGVVARNSLGGAKLDMPRELITSAVVKPAGQGPGRVRFKTRSGMYRDAYFDAAVRGEINELADELNRQH